MRMDTETKYRYQQRIKELEREISSLKDYRRVVSNVFYAIANQVTEDKRINQGWILNQFKELLK